MNQNEFKWVRVLNETHAILTDLKEMPRESYDMVIRKLVLLGSPQSLHELTKEDYEWVLQFKSAVK